MRRPTIIATPRPTVEETAKLLGIPGKEVKMVRALVNKWAYSPEIIGRFGEPRNGHTGARRSKPKGTRHDQQENDHR